MLHITVAIIDLKRMYSIQKKKYKHLTITRLKTPIIPLGYQWSKIDIPSYKVLFNQYLIRVLFHDYNQKEN